MPSLPHDKIIATISNVLNMPSERNGSTMDRDGEPLPEGVTEMGLNGVDGLTIGEWVAIALVALAALYLVAKVLLDSIVFIQNTSYGIVERKWGSSRDGNRFAPMALGNGAGFLPEVLGGGFHLLKPFAYRVHRHDRITVDGIAYLVARVGRALDEGQALGEWPAGVAVDDARGFLEKGGQRGPQRRILRSGTYAPNLALFCVVTDRHIHTMALGNSEDDKQLQQGLAKQQAFDPVVIRDDTIGIVTVQDGPALQHGEIVAPTVGTNPADPLTFHNSFQDTTRFLAAGGRRGRQEQVLVDGTYYVNRLFATVETKPKTKVEIGTVAVVNSYVGAENPEALTADNGRGRTVAKGSRGIWSTPFEPGKYPINPYAMETTVVPTTNFQLRWIAGVAGGTMGYDDDLREIPVITHDAFEILLPLSIVAHISPLNAPFVIQRFSNVQRLVTQTLDPFISAYFKDVVQQVALLDFIAQRQEIQAAALAAMRERLHQHRIDVEEVLLGTPKAPDGDQRMETVLEQLRQRQIAREQEATYESQKRTAVKRRELNEEQARADQQAEVTRSELSITIADNAGRAEATRQVRAAEGIKATADAEAYGAKARAEAIGGADMLLQQLALETIGRAVRETKSPLVPGTLVEGATGGNGNLLGSLLAAAGAGHAMRAATTAGEG